MTKEKKMSKGAVGGMHQVGSAVQVPIVVLVLSLHRLCRKCRGLSRQVTLFTSLAKVLSLEVSTGLLTLRNLTKATWTGRP